MASYPTAIKSFTDINPGDATLSTQMSQAYDEIEAIETALGISLANVLIPGDNSGKTTADLGTVTTALFTLLNATEVGTSLISDTDATDSLGSAANKWLEGFLNRITIEEGGSTTTPAAGDVALYAKADGLLYSKDDAGVETQVSGGGGRELLTAARTYYVRTDGNDSNTGLVDSAGGAFLTIQAAVNVIAETLDIGGQTVTISVGDGTYTGAVTLKNVIGFAAAGDLVIQGNNATPSNVVISTTSATAFSANGLYSIWDIKDLKIQTTTSGQCVNSQVKSVIRISNIDFGACASYHIYATTGGQIVQIGSYAITGGAVVHHSADGGSIIARGHTITLTGTPAFSFSFTQAGYLGFVYNDFTTYSGSATGKRYTVILNSVLYTGGGGAAYIPGDVAGSTATGGQYA